MNKSLLANKAAADLRLNIQSLEVDAVALHSRLESIRLQQDKLLEDWQSRVEVAYKQLQKLARNSGLTYAAVTARAAEDWEVCWGSRGFSLPAKTKARQLGYIIGGTNERSGIFELGQGIIPWYAVPFTKVLEIEVVTKEQVDDFLAIEFKRTKSNA